MHTNLYYFLVVDDVRVRTFVLTTPRNEVARIFIGVSVYTTGIARFTVGRFKTVGADGNN